MSARIIASGIALKARFSRRLRDRGGGTAPRSLTAVGERLNVVMIDLVYTRTTSRSFERVSTTGSRYSHGEYENDQAF